MGQICKCEHGSKRAAFAALLTTGLLAAALALANLAAPAPAYAAELQGSGTADDPVLIYTAEDFATWCQSLGTMGREQEHNQHARLMADLTSGEGYGGAITDDIADKMNHLDLQAAELDGNHHLMELQLTAGHNGGALFHTGGKPYGQGGNTSSTVIKDLHLVGQVQYTSGHGGSRCAATLFEIVGEENGRAEDDRSLEIRDCTNQASVIGDDAAGGFIGKYYDNQQGNLVITRCANFGDVTANGGGYGATSGNAGGIVGYIKTMSAGGPCTMQHCSNNGTITARGGDAGGLTGYVYVKQNPAYDFDYCFNQGTISVSDNSNPHAGGMVGFLDGQGHDVLPITHTACYNTGTIDASFANAGGIFGGRNVTVSLSRCYTCTASVPHWYSASSDLNGTFIGEIEFLAGVAYDLGYEAYTERSNSHETCLDYPNYAYPLLKDAGAGKIVTTSWVMPLTGEAVEGTCYWNTVPASPSMNVPEGYHLAYWTREAPKADGTWDAPPEEYKMSNDDIHDRLYGGTPVFYAYCVPDFYTVEFDLNAPSRDNYKMDPPKEQTTGKTAKTVVKGEPLGALPVCYYAGTPANEGCPFLGWATKPDGNNPTADWVNEGTTDLSDYLDEKTNSVTLYAQWGTERLKQFEIIRQPEDWSYTSALADGDHGVWFDFATSYPVYDTSNFDTTLQRKKDGVLGGTWEDVDGVGLNGTYCSFDIESADEARYDYRFKIEYRDAWYSSTVYTGSARIVLDIPQTAAEVSSVKLKDDTVEDEILGRHSYDIAARLVGDVPVLMDQEDEFDYGHLVWIEGGPANIVTEKRSIEGRTIELENQHLQEGQSYTLCVARASYQYGKPRYYQGESEPYRVPFVVPYADKVAASITAAQVSSEPVVDGGKAVDFNADYSVPVNGTFNLAADASWAQPVSYEVAGQWQYRLESGRWVDVPDDYFAKDADGNPIRGMVWTDDRKQARLYASLDAKAALDTARFRVKLSAPPATADAISDESAKRLTVFVPQPELTEPKVTNDTHVSVSWTWQDGAGKTAPSEGYYVEIRRESPDGSGEGDLVDSGRVFTPTYDATLEPQRNYRVYVRADTSGLQGASTEREFSTTGTQTLTWGIAYCNLWAPSQQIEKRHSSLNVDYGWADYQDGKHVALYTWKLSSEMDNPEKFDTFVTTETDEVTFPDAFEGDGQPWDIEKAQWVQVSASVWELDEQGEPKRELEETRVDSAVIPVIHSTTDAQNLRIEDVGSSSATACWDAPAEGFVREYRVDIQDRQIIVAAVEGQTHYELKVDGLDNARSARLYVCTVDPRKRDGVVSTAEGPYFYLLSHPEAGAWTASASFEKDDLVVGDTLTLAGAYEAKSGTFSKVELQWYSWREGEGAWQPEGDPVVYEDKAGEMPVDEQALSATFARETTSGDYGRQWKLGVKANTIDESVTGNSNAVTVTLTPPQMKKVELGEPTTDSLTATFPEIEGIKDAGGGYTITHEEIDNGYIVRSVTRQVNASELEADAEGRLHYQLTGLKSDTAYRVLVSAFAYGASGVSGISSSVKTLPEPTINPPAFTQAPKSVRVEAGADAVFTGLASVGDEAGTVEYRWQRKGAGEEAFADIAAGDKYDIGTDPDTGVTALTVKNVGAAEVGAAFRCVAVHVYGDQGAETASGAAYLSVVSPMPTDAKTYATGPTTAEVTWTPNEAVRRYLVTYEGIDPVSEKVQKFVTLEDGATTGLCQLDGLLPGSIYAVDLYAAPQAGFWSGRVYVGAFTTPLASALDTATVSPEKKLVEPGETVEFKVETNVDGDASESLTYRWQRNAFGEGWYDVEGGTAATLSVTAPEGDTVDGYRCIVDSVKTSKDGTGQKSVTSSVGLLATSVPVEAPVRLEAVPDITSVHLSWASADARAATYEVQYAEGPTPPADDAAWTTVENVGAVTSCDVEGLAPNTVYVWRVRAAVSDLLAPSEWASGSAFTTLAEPTPLVTVSVTPRWGTAVAGDAATSVDYTAVTNIDGTEAGKTLAYQWQVSASGEEWRDIADQTKSTFTAPADDPKPRTCRYRCVVTATIDGVPTTATSEAASFSSEPKVPFDLTASDITAATASLAWSPALSEGDGLTYRVFWRASGTESWESASSAGGGREAKYALSSLMPATTYEWYVQVMNEGRPSVKSATSLFVTQSLPLVPELTRVVAGPLDQTPAYGAQATLKAFTNVDDVDSSLATKTHQWQVRALDSDPDDPNAWSTVGGDASTVTLDANTTGYVRCTVTYEPNGLAPSPLAGTAVTSNEARVRVMPALPADSTVDKDTLTQTSADLSWTGGTAQGNTFDVVYRAVNAEGWQQATGLAEAKLALADLAPGTAYEWYVRGVAAYAGSDPLNSDWVAGPVFSTLPADIVFSKVEVAPSAPSVVVGTDSTIELATKADNDPEHETLEYQWQRYDGSEWKPVDGATNATLELSTGTLPVGTHVYRCVVTATREGAPLPKTVTSNESIVTVMPLAPTDLSVSDIHRLYPDDPNHTNTAATFHFKWVGVFDQQDEVQFEVSYQKIAGGGATVEWKSLTFEYDESMVYVTESLEDEDLTYQWRVRAVQNGVASPWSEVETFNTTLKEPEDLNWTEVTPSNSLVGAADTVELAATTNVDDKENKGTLAYTWEWCELTDDPRTSASKPATWTTIENETSDTITLSPNDPGSDFGGTNRYVRCRVTQVETGKEVVSNPARVRVEPLPPYDLSTSMYSSPYGDSGVVLRWKCDDSRKTKGSVLGFEVNYRKVGASEWVNVPWVERNRSNNSYTLSSLSAHLEPDATYEWRVRTVLNNYIKESWGSGGPHTEWVDGEAFTMPKVDVTPTRAAAVIGNGRTVTFAATPSDAMIKEAKSVTYTWKRKVAGSNTWEELKGETSPTPNVKADEATAAGANRFRCEVGVDDQYHATSNEAVLALAPAAPTGLETSDVKADKATLAWQWEKGCLPNADGFKVLYRESGTMEWTTVAVEDGTQSRVLEGLKPETVYEWHVQAVQNDVESLPSFASLFATLSEHPDPQLESVVVAPADQEVAPTDQAKLAATTNLDGMEGVDTAGKLSYAWEKRALDSRADDPAAWTKVDGAEAREVELPANTNGYVRCQATYTSAPGASPVTVPSNEARVRVRPADAPTGLTVGDVGQTEADLSWSGTLPEGCFYALAYRPAGTENWTTVSNIEQPSYTVEDLAPNTLYDWRVCTVSGSGLASAWTDGEAFITVARESTLTGAAVSPESATAVAGGSDLVTAFSATVSGGEGETLAYQWQSQVGGTWADLPGETGASTHLSVASWEAGSYALRCAVTATPAGGGTPKTVESNTVTLVLSPMPASDLGAQNVQTDAATLVWTWTGPGTAPSFNVQYREEGASEWSDVPVDQIDAANTTCTVESLVPGTSYEWQVQAKQGGQVSEWAASGFVTQSGGSLKVARIWPPDVAVAVDEQAKFAAFTNRGMGAEGITYAWQHRALDSKDVEEAWELIEGEADRVITLDANTTGYVRCVATQAAPGADAVEAIETSVAGTDETAETNEADDTSEAIETNETLKSNEAAETFAAPTPVVVVSNQARVRVAPGVPSGLAAGEVRYRDAALSWAPADVAGSTFTLAYRATGTDAWTELSGLTDPSHVLGGLVPGTPYDWRVQAVVGEGDDALTSEWANGDSFTTLALKTYPVIAGADGTWKPGQSGLAFTIDAPFDKFLSAAVDGVELVRDRDYTAAEGSTVVTLSSDYLATLAAGKHVLEATFTDGKAQTAFTVASDQPGPPPVPDGGGDSNGGGATLAPTGDPLATVVAIAGMGSAVALIALATGALRRRRR